MRIVFMGTPEFAVASLDALVNSQHQVVGVVTVPDKPAGRGKKLRASAVKDYALENNIPILQPEKLKDPDFINSLKERNADIFVVVAFRMLPKVVWSIPPKGCFNIHGSLLPHYRGAAPINHAIINGETESGLTTFMIDEKIDTGKIILQKKAGISPQDSAGILHDKLMELSRKIVTETCELIESGEAELIDQSSFFDQEEELKPAPKIFKEDCHLKLESGIEYAYNLVRGLSPYPAAFVKLISPEGQDSTLKLFETSIEQKNSIAGEIYTNNEDYFALGFEGGRLRIHNLQLQSKKRMLLADFLRGFSINEDWHWQ